MQTQTFNTAKEVKTFLKGNTILSPTINGVKVAGLLDVSNKFVTGYVVADQSDMVFPAPYVISYTY